MHSWNILAVERTPPPVRGIVFLVTSQQSAEVCSENGPGQPQPGRAARVGWSQTESVAYRTHQRQADSRQTITTSDQSQSHRGSPLSTLNVNSLIIESQWPTGDPEIRQYQCSIQRFEWQNSFHIYNPSFRRIQMALLWETGDRFSTPPQLCSDLDFW